MEFAAANIWQDFKTESQTGYGTLEDNANEVILGPKLNHAVRDLANGYLRNLELGSAHKATDERAKLLDLHWGRIEQDGALLRGLGAAMTNFAETLGVNVGKLAERWEGESYDAFKTAIDKVRGTLAEYGAAATTTGDGLVNAMSQVRELYQTFADDSANKHLNFDGFSKPEEWHKVEDWGPEDSDKEVYSGRVLAECCPSSHGSLVDYNLNCLKNDDEQRNIITGRFVSQRRWDICKNDPCEENAGRVNIMYRTMVDECQAAIDRIKGKLDSYYGAVKTTTDGVTELYDAALGNVYKLANAEVFSSLRVLGGQPAGGPPDGGGDPSGGSPYPSGGEVSPEPAAVTEPVPQPEPAPETEPAPVETSGDTPPADTVAQEPPVTDQRESVEVKDGDRTIGVTSQDGEGRVRVTVQDGTGATKTYDLDFAAASGLPTEQPVDVAPGPDGTVPEQVPARTDGKCVIQDGALTITAERPLFSPDSIKLVVDDGTGDPSTYTLDFEDQTTPAGPEAPGQPGITPQPVATSTGQPDAAPANAGPAAAPAGNGTAMSTGAGPVATDHPDAASTGAGPMAPGQPGAAPVSAGLAGAGAAAPTLGTPVPGPDQLTAPQAWHGDQSGSVSGVLVPDQPDGEAGLPKAPDAAEPQVGGMAGAGLPIMGGGPSGGSQDGGRVGSGWSVHGDLFDKSEPVYSMHGVLGDDDGTAE